MQNLILSQARVHRGVVFLMLLCSTFFANRALAQSPPVAAAGEVEFMRGVGFAQSPGQAPRTLGRGLALMEGDRLTTADGASAVVKLQDGTRMTVRPGSEMILTQFKYRQDAQDNGMVISMLRGGLRAITGLISKSSPNAARVQTNTATIGIRGTDFDARICQRDCGAEAAQVAQAARPNAVQASAKAVSARGEVSVVDGSGQRRRLVSGGGVYAGEVVETGPTTQVVLAFRDESKVTVGAVSRFRVDTFVFDSGNPSEGRMLASLLKGTVRALTGLIGKANSRNVTYSTSTATIGIRGTDVLMRCSGVCAQETGEPADGLSVFVYAGSIGVTRVGETGTFLVSPNAGLNLTPAGSQALTIPPANDLTPPQEVVVPPALFETSSTSENKEGLYVFVRDGHIELTTSSSVLHLGRNEAGMAGNDGQVARPQELPRFIEFDRTPLPNANNFNVSALLADTNSDRGRVCR